MFANLACAERAANQSTLGAIGALLVALHVVSLILPPIMALIMGNTMLP